MSSSLVDCFSSYYIDKAVRSLQYLKKNNLFKLKEIHRCKNIFVSLSNHSDQKKIYGVKKGGNKTIVWMECRPLQRNIEHASLAPFLL